MQKNKNTSLDLSDHQTDDCIVDLSDAIRSNFDILCRDTVNLRDICTFLYQRQVVTSKECERIVNEDTNFYSFHELYRILLQKANKDHYRPLIYALKESGNEHIVRLLGAVELKTKTEGTASTIDTEIQQLLSQAINLHGEGILVNYNAVVENPKQKSHIFFNIQDQVDFFTGQERILLDLHEKIEKNKKKLSENPTVLSKVIVITGMAGVGKTQLVRKYIFVHRQQYDHVVWIDAENHIKAKDCFSQLAETQLGIPLKDIYNREKDFEKILKDSYNALCKKNCLIVFDNADSLENNEPVTQGISSLLPRSFHPSLNVIPPTILVTSRNQDWREELIFMNPFSEKESVDFILKQLNMDLSSENIECGIQVGRLFGGLPVALQNFVAFWKAEIEKVSHSEEALNIAEFSNYYLQIQGNILNFDCKNTKISITRTWEIIFDKIQTECGVDIKLLHFLSFFNAVNIPKQLVFLLFKDISHDNIIEALFILAKYSIVQISDASSISIHCIVQDVMREILRERNFIYNVMVKLCRIFKRVVQSWSKEDRLYPYVLQHADQVVNNAILEKVVAIEVNDFIGYTRYTLLLSRMNNPSII